MRNYLIRPGRRDDLPFLKTMLYEAVFWNPAAERIPTSILFREPEIAKILDEWGERHGDFSLIAEDNQQNSVGAAWYRFWTDDNYSYGYVDENTPEIGIGLQANHRGNRLGTRLMKDLTEHARASGVHKLSLSVDPNNPALRLYRKLGFNKISESGSSWTMLLIL